MKYNKLYFLDDLIKFVLNHPKYGKHYDFTYKLQFYDLPTILKEIFHLSNNLMSYNDYRGSVNRKSLNWHINKFAERNILNEYYKFSLNRYFKSNLAGKLKYQSVDSFFIPNKYGVNEIGRNKFYKSKKGTKISIICDNLNVPISVEIRAGNNSDKSLLVDNLNNFFINTKTFHLKDSNKYKQYLLADKGYDFKDIRQILTDKGYYPIIDHNKRNTKDLSKIKKLSKKGKNLYKKRIHIERLISHLKYSVKRLLIRFDRNIKTFNLFIFISIIVNIYRILFKQKHKSN